MASKLEVFDADAVEVDESAVCAFKLGGREWSCKGRDAIDAALLDDVFAGDAVRIKDFFAAVLVDDEVDEFLEMLNNGDGKLSLGRLQPLMEFVVEKVMDYPTEPPATSQGGRPKTGGSSVAGSPSRATRRAR